MSSQIAVAFQIKKACIGKVTKTNALVHILNLLLSIAYSILNEKSKKLDILLIEKICISLEISSRAFFNNHLFYIQEVK